MGGLVHGIKRWLKIYVELYYMARYQRECTVCGAIYFKGLSCPHDQRRNSRKEAG